ncbi:MAG TPA: response regulator [Flavisolibacter sp.]|jgi:DNA-binding response OmpR family regulator|nr:response regulator [Flavisolibacter sp.]
MNSQQFVCYVDDDEDDRHLLREAFQAYPQYDLRLFEKSEQLFEFLKQGHHHTSLIILDINLPIVSGLDILENLKKHALYKPIPTVMFSTARNYAQTRFVTELGSDIVVKPTSYTGVQSVLTKLLSYCRAQG